MKAGHSFWRLFQRQSAHLPVSTAELSHRWSKASTKVGHGSCRLIRIVSSPRCVVFAALTSQVHVCFFFSHHFALCVAAPCLSEIESLAENGARCSSRPQRSMFKGAAASPVSWLLSKRPGSCVLLFALIQHVDRQVARECDIPGPNGERSVVVDLSHMLGKVESASSSTRCSHRPLVQMPFYRFSVAGKTCKT